MRVRLLIAVALAVATGVSAAEKKPLTVNDMWAMLVLHGERDFRVPVTQGLALYGVLKTKGVPARLVYYPDENHWVLKGQNSKHWYGEVLGWLARWLK